MKRLLALLLLVCVLAGCQKPAEEPTAPEIEPSPVEQPTETIQPEEPVIEPWTAEQTAFLERFAPCTYTWTETPEEVWQFDDLSYSNWSYPNNWLYVSQFSYVLFSGVPYAEECHMVGRIMYSPYQEFTIEELLKLFGDRCVEGYSELNKTSYVAVPMEGYDLYFHANKLENKSYASHRFVEYRMPGYQWEMNQRPEDTETATSRRLAEQFLPTVRDMIIHNEWEREFLLSDIMALENRTYSPTDMMALFENQLGLHGATEVNGEAGPIASSYYKVKLSHGIELYIYADETGSIPGDAWVKMQVNNWQYFEELDTLIEDENPPLSSVNRSKNLVFLGGHYAGEIVDGQWGEQSSGGFSSPTTYGEFYLQEGYHTYTTTEYIGFDRKIGDIELPVLYIPERFYRMDPWFQHGLTPWEFAALGTIYERSNQHTMDVITMTATHDPRPKVLPVEVEPVEADFAALDRVLEEQGIGKANRRIAAVYQVDLTGEGETGRVILADWNMDTSINWQDFLTGTTGAFCLALWEQNGAYELININIDIFDPAYISEKSIADATDIGDIFPAYTDHGMMAVFDDSYDVLLTLFDANNDGSCEIYLNVTAYTYRSYRAFDKIDGTWQNVLVHGFSAS